MLLLFIFSFLLPEQPVDPYTSITNQANMYLESFQKNEQTDLNFWAINELYSSNCGENKIVERLVHQAKSDLIREIFIKYECLSSENEDSLKFERFKFYALETGSVPIAVHYLSQTETSSELNQFYNNFTNQWFSELSAESSAFLEAVKDRESVSSHLTNFNNQLFNLYSLLYSDYVNSYFSTEDFDSIINELSAGGNSGNPPFNRSLVNFNLLKAAYETNRYQYISTIFADLIESDYYPNTKKKVGIFSGLDFSLSVTGGYSESLYLQRNEILPLATHYNLKSRVDYTKLQQSANLYALGKFSEAKTILEKLYNDSNSYIPKSQLYNNLSLSYQKLGEKNKYTSFLFQAIQEVENNKISDDNYYTVKLGLFRNLFVYYNSIGDSINAISYINRAKSLAENQKDKNELSAINIYLGDYYIENFKNYEKALFYYNKADYILKSIDNYLSEKDVLLSKANLFAETDSLENAKASVKEIKDLASRNSDTSLFIEGLIFEAEIASMQNDISMFQSVIDEIGIYSLDNLEFEVLIRYHNLYATLLHKKGLHRDAYTYFKPILDQVIDRARGSVESQTGFWTVEEEYLDGFELMISILDDLGHIQESITYLDQLKTINDAALYNNPLLRANKLTEKELAEEKKLSSRIQSLRNQYLSADQEQKFTLKTEIDRLSAQRQLLVNKVNTTYSEKNLPVWKVQQQMAKDELILHYTEINEKLYVSSISKHTIDLSVLEITKEVDSLLNNTANTLATGKTSLYNLFEIYNFLELDEIPETINQITVIPDNELYRIPLDVLPTKKPNSGFSFGSSHYMIEDYSFKYFTSLQDYANNNRNTVTSLSTDFSAFAISYFEDFTEKDLPSLPFATQEVRNIQKVLTSFDQKQIFTGNQATEHAFQTQLNSSKILHIATHSEVSHEDPLFSTIYLKSNDNNGTEGDALYAYELFDNQLNNNLIMLNSCSSGSGNYLQGTGIMGISRALRYAGAKSLALNLWEVNDMIASEFARDFYSYLNKGYSKSSSMRLAKINQIKTGSADPHYWGAYTLIGNSSPVIKKPTSSQFVLPLMITVGLLAGYRVRKKI